MNNNLVVGVDIGGTRTKYGLVNVATGQVLETLIMPTETGEETPFIRQVGTAIDTFRNLAAAKGMAVSAIGIGVPGYVDAAGLVATTYGFLRFMENYPLRKVVESNFDLPCYLDNDARVVSLGEALFGKGKLHSRVLTLTIGTGVGFGFVVDGKFPEDLPLAHMGGHMKISDNDTLCYCGKNGCLEALVCSSGIVGLAQTYTDLQHLNTAEGVFRAALAETTNAKKVVATLIGYLHTGIHNYVNLFAPDIIILGGGVAKGFIPYLKQIRGRNYLAPYPAYDFVIEVSELEELSGMLGSAALSLVNKTSLA